MTTLKIFKKTSESGHLTVYLSQREFYDCIDFCETITGVVVVEDEFLNGRNVYAKLTITYQYGHDEDEVMGVKFSRDFLVCNEQIYPADYEPAQITPVQAKTIQKNGTSSHPFMLHFPKNAPNSVVLQDPEADKSRPLGVSYTVTLFVGDAEDPEFNNNLIEFKIIKLQNAQASREPRHPRVLVSKEFMFSPGNIDLEVTLDRELYFHFEKVPVTVLITNDSNKTVRSIKCNIIQSVEVTMIGNTYKKEVASLETREGCPIVPGTNMSKSLFLMPSAMNNTNCRGIALDGYIKSADLHLASSTMAAEGKAIESIGIIVSYSVYVELDCGTFGGVVSAELPLKLINPPPGSIASIRTESSKKMQSIENRRKRDSLFENENNLVFRGRRPSVYEPDE